MHQMIIGRARVTLSDLQPIGGLPLLLNADAGAVNAVDWITEYCGNIQQVIHENGALLIRGLKILGSAQFGKILSTLFGAELLEYVYRSTPRTALRGNVYTATEYPANRTIPQHNENSYSRHWPNRIGFLCMLPSQTGGETPISDSRLVYNLLPQEIRKKFEAKGVLYVRNYSTLDLPWPVVFQTSDRHAVESYCRRNGLSFAWRENDGLRTSQVNPALARHPVTGERVWFNQAHLFHVSSLSSDIAGTLMSSLGEENLPRNAYYGDGSPIEPEVVATIHAAYERTKIKFEWQKNDLLLLDNMVYAHGRESYTGSRTVLTGMACPNTPNAESLAVVSDAHATDQTAVRNWKG
jgi:hypothetical protein